MSLDVYFCFEGRNKPPNTDFLQTRPITIHKLGQLLLEVNVATRYTLLRTMIHHVFYVIVHI